MKRAGRKERAGRKARASHPQRRAWRLPLEWPSRLTLLGILGIGVLVVASYLPALRAGFVWDDVILTKGPVIRQWSGLWNIWLSPSDIENERHYWPMVFTSFWLEHKLWGLAPFGYHLVNVLLHAAISLLVWRLLARLAVPGAWFAGALFAVHPLHVESVAWVIERKDLLSSLFYLAAVLTWIRFVETPRWGYYALALALFIAGLLSKSMVVTLPAALLVWHWWKRERVTSTDLVRLAPFFVVGLCITLADYSYYTSRESVSLGYTVVERVLIASRALWFYVGKLLWPSDLAVIYPLWEIRATDPVGWLYVLAAAALPGFLWFGRERVGRGPLAAALFFAVTLSPVLGFVDFRYMQYSLVADRFQYLAGIAVLAVLSAAAAHGLGKLPETARKGAPYLAAVVLVSLGALTWRHAGIYRNEVTFFSHIVSLNPDGRNAHTNLASALINADRPEEALSAARLAVEKRPESAVAYNNLGLALLRLQRFDEAEETLRRALELDPSNRSAGVNLAVLLRQQKRYEAAVETYRKVIERHRKYVKAHAGLGNALFRLGRYEEARSHLSKALSLAPPASLVASLHGTLGRTLLRLGRIEAAEEQLLYSLKMDPELSATLLGLAALRAEQKRFKEADEYFERARKLNPQDPVTLQNTAESLRKRGRNDEALGLYRAALEIDPDYALAYAGMAHALFNLKRYEEAVEAVDRSLALDSNPSTTPPRHVLKGHAYRELGWVEDALAQYERALAVDPGYRTALEHLATGRFGQKRYREALELGRRLAEAYPDSGQYQSAIGIALYHLGQPEQALNAFERALALDPSLETAREGLKMMRQVLKQRKP